MVEIIKIFFNIIKLVNVQEFKQRLISTIALSILFMTLFLFGNPFFSIFFSLFFIFVFFEYEKLTAILIKKLQILKSTLLQIFLFLFTISEIFDFQILPSFFNNFVFFVCISLLINIIFFIYKNTILINFIISNLIIFSFFSLISILQKPDGLNILLYVVILVSTMDIFAYVGGKLFGQNKIIPKISKGKTYEGTIIGIVFTIILSALIRELVNLNITHALIYGLIISILAFLGDLVESIFKRNIGVKDSGKLIPGHGGLMDRFDGYFIVFPFIYFYIN